MTIRSMNEDDLPAVSWVFSKCYRWLGRLENYTSQQIEFLVSKRASLESLTREYQTQQYLVACEGADVVGMVAVSGNEITKLYVVPDHHRKQIGTQLFGATEAAIRNAGHESLVLGAFPTSVQFYRAVGLIVTARKPHGPGPLAGLSVTLMENQLTRPEA
jgi:ribosomal protein S18 acetylase RimI-like enzyme